MEYRINAVMAANDVEAIEQAIREMDPAAMAGLDPGGEVLMVSTVIGDEALLSILKQGGHCISAAQLERVPSVCCGGCGG